MLFALFATSKQAFCNYYLLVVAAMCCAHAAMPHGDLTITEAKVVKWLKQPGETVRLGDPVVEMETDKAVTEIETPAAGVLDGILAPEGTVVALDQQLATIRPA